MQHLSGHDKNAFATEKCQGGESMLPIRKPSREELLQALRASRSGEELDDREIWILREYF